MESHVCAGRDGDGGKPYHVFPHYKEEQTPHMIQTNVGKWQGIDYKLEKPKVCVNVYYNHKYPLQSNLKFKISINGLK